jgi:LAS superfamily LD-carboxypeptidase LdcB
MINAAKTDGKNLEPVSGYRSFEEQALQRIEFCSDGQTDVTVDRIFVNSNANCSTPVSIPGTSNHNKGKAMDFGFNGVTDDPSFASAPEHAWLMQNASKYGFKTISGEPWHWEYN